MRTRFAIQKAGSREALARLLHVEVITTYHWKRHLPEKHDRYLRALKPDWYIDELPPPTPPTPAPPTPPAALAAPEEVA